MDISTLLPFLAASAVLALIPGPDTLYVISESMVKGYKAGIAIAVGLCTGCIIHTGAAASGVSVALTQSPLAFAAIKVVGALYLGYLAILSFREKVEHPDLESDTHAADHRLWDYTKRGFLMNVLNPRVSLFFIAFFPQFVDATSGSVPVQMLMLGGIFIGESIVLFIIMAILAARLRTVLGSTVFWHATKWVKVGLFSFLAVSLVWSI